MVVQGFIHMMPYIIPLLLCTYTMSYHFIGINRTTRNVTFPTGSDSIYIMRKNPHQSIVTVVYPNNRQEKFEVDKIAFAYDVDTHKFDIIELSDSDRRMNKKVEPDDRDKKADQNANDNTAKYFNNKAVLNSLIPTNLEIMDDLKERCAFKLIEMIYATFFLRIRVRFHSDYLYIYIDRSDIIPYNIIHLPEIGKYSFQYNNFMDLLKLMIEHKTPIELTDDDTLNTVGVFISNGFLDDSIILMKRDMIACLHGLNVRFIFYPERRSSFEQSTTVIKFKGANLYLWSMISNRFETLRIKRSKIAYKVSQKYFESLKPTQLHGTLQKMPGNKEGLEFLKKIIQNIDKYMIKQRLMVSISNGMVNYDL
ncbi:hypothetical protein VCUG_02067 [Vavraia culicis subsp. floridensis]|uniref:Uncharacterized protein n=1 Tax=Vavraia culicis (isolate floridensis) TaxID=948595 RepID=L2GS03_VAVCU|nr:uncharacterized protein VCUG_02067 [Vavraia culicis subsp. floridensis]ELA46431.1 hypothetical protein VCUG_02067 [Vavraia culicis subsp. floridensis]